MAKLTYKEALKSTTMFLCDSEIEAYYENYITTQVKLLKEKLSGIGTLSGLQSYIKSESDSIDNIITLLGISVERFKRVISCIRLNHGFNFESELTPKTLRSELIKDPKMMKEYCKLFSFGYVTPEFAAIIPKFLLHDFRIDNNTLERLRNDDYIRSLLKEKVTTSYNAKYCDLYHRKLDMKIEEIAFEYGLHYTSQNITGFKVKPLNVIAYTNRYIIINTHFQLTTSSSQTKYYNNKIRMIVEDAQSNVNVIVINVLDGAGWIARGADFKKVFRDCDHFLNFKTIDNLNSIIKEFFNLN